MDLSEGALAKVRKRLGERAAGVRFEQGDARTLKLDRPTDVWHDRAVFHFLTAEDDRAAYLETLAATLRVGGHAVFATFALDGPDVCSLLPVQRYSPESLAETLGTGYHLVRSLERTHVTPKQKDQRFTYAVFRREA
jgi:SAM-dependent methyltransferase